MFIWYVLLFLISSVDSIHFHSNENSLFVIYPRLYLCNNGSFSLEFRTKTNKGLIFFTNDQQYHDSIIVSVYQSKLIVEQKFGKSKSSQQFDQSVDDDKWYKIVFKRRSSLLTEIALYSVALRNVENRILKSKSLNYLPFTSMNTSSMVYIGGLPRNFSRQQRQSNAFLFESFHGFVRNLRYGFCGCAERIQYPLFSSLSTNLQTEVCEQQISLCSSSACECLNVDEEPRYQCDCSNKTCNLLTLMNKNLIQYQIDFTSVEYLSKSDASSFTFGIFPNVFDVQKKDTVMFSPRNSLTDNCMWDLNRCSAELTWTLILSIERLNASSSIFTQYFKHDASIQVNLVVFNASSSNLHFDLWLPSNRGLLRTHLTEFPYETPLFINLIYRPPTSFSVSLFGQLMDYTNNPLSFPSPSRSDLSFNVYVPFRSISWSYEQSPSACCAFLHNDERSKRDLPNLDTCQSFLTYGCRQSRKLILIDRHIACLEQ